MTTAINWTAYKVTKNGCGDPDELIGYYQTYSRALDEAMKENGTKTPGHGFCCHDGGKCVVEEITISA